MKIFILLLLLLPVTLQAQIYRCASKGATFYSQIPCTDNAQVVVIEDHPMFSDSASGVKSKPEQESAPAKPERTQADNMQEFISTLRRQRIDQLQQLDGDIAKLRAKLNAAGDSPEEPAQQAALSKQIKDLQASRSSITEQYDSMLAEAERRVAALAAKRPEPDKQNK